MNEIEEALNWLDEQAKTEESAQIIRGMLIETTKLAQRLVRQLDPDAQIGWASIRKSVDPKDN